MLEKIHNSELIKVLGFLKERTGKYIFFTILKNAITSICFNIVIAFITKDIFDAVTYKHSFLIMQASMLAIGAFIIGAILSPIASYAVNKCIKETMKEIRTITFEKIQNLPIGCFENTHSGEFTSIATNDLNSIEAIYSTEINYLVFAIIHGIVSMISIFILQWKISIIVLVLGIITIVINNFFVSKIRNYSDKIQAQLSNITKKLIDLIQSSSITKMFNFQNNIYGYFKTENEKHFNFSMGLTRTESLFEGMNVLLSNLKYIGVLCIALFMLYKGYIVAGTVVAVMHLMGNANFMFENIGTFIKDIQKSLAGASRVLKLLDMEAENDDLSEDVQKKHTDNLVEFNNVTFGYTDTPVLKNLKLNIKKGSVTAFVGSSGCGKSTLTKLLLRFYNVTSGYINIGGENILNYSLDTLRDKFAYVPQNPFLFQGTIGENIGYGNPSADKNSIIAAAKAANAHDFIMALPNGYNTLVGERGENLSGGQKQRIAIARALIKNAPILLLDEATSALDSESELEIENELNNLMKNRTTIVIAHKLSAIKNADKIYIINHGKIADHGNYEDLSMKMVSSLS